MMSGDEYREIIRKLGMSHRGAALFLGLAERSNRRYIRDGMPLQAIEILLRVMLAKRITPEDAYKIAGLKVPDSYEDSDGAFADQRLRSYNFTARTP